MKKPRIGTAAAWWRVVTPAAVVGLALPLAVAGPAQAQGGNAVRYGSYVVYTANAGEQNDVIVGVLQNEVAIQDEAGVTAGPGCVQRSDILATCGPAASVGRVTVQLRDGDDQIVIAATLNTTIDAGTGTDTVRTAGGSDQINLRDGAPGDVVESCGAGFDYVAANPGDTVATDCEQRAFY
ncbi:hypothetical protein [Streptomyces sp. TRM64462]|uniref:hypothetical protein n=1 Tax=Streptomyces sp. TRM64462 TaxID=2741726 RepID=UPI001586D1DB|nr:hypothetical protein [Streptomyces sp. TRM64462]